MKIALSPFALAGLLLASVGLIACSDLQMRPQPATPDQISSSTDSNGTLNETSPSPSNETSAPAPVSWSSILGSTSAPEGWRVEPCVNPSLLCVYQGEELMGTVELFSQPVAGSEFERILAEAQREPIVALRRWTDIQYESIRRDRQIGDSTIRFAAEPPEEVAVGNLQGIRYGFTNTHANGVLIDRAIGYAATDGTTLYVIATGVISQDPTGSFSSDEDAQIFLPHLATIVQNLTFNSH